MARTMSLEATEVYAVKIVRHYVRNGQPFACTDVVGPYQTLGAAKGQSTAASKSPWYSDAKTEVTLYKATVQWEEIDNG